MAAADPVNPTGFTAVQVDPNTVTLMWRAVRGISSYLLLGPGLPRSGVRVTGATTYTVVKIPPGPQRWLVGSVLDTGASTPVASFTAADLEVGKP